MFEQSEGDWSELSNLWIDTRKTRLDMWRSKTSGLRISNLYETFSILNDARGDNLIIQDFENLYPNAKPTFLNWAQNYKRVLNEARKYRDEYAKRLINRIDLMEESGTKVTSLLK